MYIHGYAICVMKKLAIGSLVTALSFVTIPAAQAVSLDPQSVPDRTQITVRHDSGATVSTANSHESRPALSLSKLYLGYWVLKYGSAADKAQVENMIRYSDDNVASDLDRRYPQAIPSIIQEFGLSETHYTGYWGTTQTSTEDIARFTAEIQHDPIAAPIFAGMATAAPVAADGYRQDFGTDHIPGVWGTKFGWSDDRTIHASVSTGHGFTVAAPIRMAMRRPIPRMSCAASTMRRSAGPVRPSARASKTTSTCQNLRSRRFAMPPAPRPILSAKRARTLIKPWRR